MIKGCDGNVSTLSDGQEAELRFGPLAQWQGRDKT
jgi:hypothetical protein